MGTGEPGAGTSGREEAVKYLGVPVVGPLEAAAHLLPEAQFAVGRDRARDISPVEIAEFTLAPEAERDVVAYIHDTHRERLPELLDLRVERMSTSPFAFFRGTAGLMAADLAQAPSSGLLAQICGDAHGNNFGLYAAVDGDIVMDINDFDETIVAAWEWDLKRLVTSLVLAGREAGAKPKRTRDAVHDCAKAYRRSVKRLAKMPYLTSFMVAADEDRLTDHDELGDAFESAVKKARKNTSEKVVKKSVEHIDDHDAGISRQRFIDDEPVLFHVERAEIEAVLAGVRDYLDTVRESRRALLQRYRMVDVAFRVVGTGSVGMRSYIVLLAGNDDEWLVLQVKQAAPSVLAPYVDAAQTPVAHDGERIVQGARLVQSRSDHLMGWTTIDGRSYIVRQFRNAKGSLDPLDLSPKELDDFGMVCGSLLARAHCRSLNPNTLAGYLDDADGFYDALVEFAERYADQVEVDYENLIAAIEHGEFAS